MAESVTCDPGLTLSTRFPGGALGLFYNLRNDQVRGDPLRPITEIELTLLGQPDYESTIGAGVIDPEGPDGEVTPQEGPSASPLFEEADSRGDGSSGEPTPRAPPRDSSPGPITARAETLVPLRAGSGGDLTPARETDPGPDPILRRVTRPNPRYYWLEGLYFGTDRSILEVYENDVPVPDERVVELHDRRIKAESDFTGSMNHRVVVGERSSQTIGFQHN